MMISSEDALCRYSKMKAKTLISTPMYLKGQSQKYVFALMVVLGYSISDNSSVLSI